MIMVSVITYVIIAGWYLFGSDRSQRVSSFLGTCMSSFFAFWYLDESNVAMIVYIVMGLLCIFFNWIADDSEQVPPKKRKNKYIAAILALLFGGYGVHKFYLRKHPVGLLYVLFCWSSIPGIIGVIEAAYFLVMKREKFNQVYNRIGTTQQATVNQVPKQEKQVKQAKQSEQSKKCVEAATDKEYGYAKCNVEDHIDQSGVNERDEDALNYQDIRVCGYRAQAVGTIEDFSIVIQTDGNTYTFKAKNGDICSYRSSTMRGTKHYEVT